MESRVQRLIKMHPVILREFNRINAGFSQNLDLPVVQFKTVMMIANEKHCNLSDIAKAMTIAPSWASETVEKLVKKGMLIRKVCAKDRRQIDLTLDLKGKEFVREFRKWEVEYFKRLLEILDTEEDKQKLLRGFELFFEVAHVLEKKRLGL